MSVITKAKINLKEGTIELEGSEAFVTKYLDEFRKEIKGIAPAPEGVKRKERKARKVAKKPLSIAPIPVDLKGKDDKPSLRDFYKQRSPQTNEEKVTAFTYYLGKYLGIENVEPGHIVSCCNEVRTKKPKNIPSLFKNIKYRKGWIDWGTKSGTVKITTPGENLIEYDLPRKKKNVSKNKGATEAGF